MRKVLKFVKGRREDRKDHGSSGRSLGPFSDLPSPDQVTPTDEHGPGFEHAFGYHVDLTGKDKTVTKLHKAAWQGNLEKLKVNMRKIDIDVIDRNNRTPLHLAAAQGHANIVWFLLGNKANMNICDKEGKTPFLKAIECGHKETIQIMLERGVDINTIDYTGNSGLHIASKQGYYEIASMLLKQGANFDSSNNFGEFPLHIATVAENKDLVELLLRYGSSVNVVDRDNRSPLMFAAKCGSMTLVQLFLEYGAQRAVMDSNDWTAEDYALMGGYHDVAAELKSPSERMMLSYTGKTEETSGHNLGILVAKRSISDASLPPDPPEKDKEDTNVAVKQTEEADNSDTWNDSQVSDSSLKQKAGGLKLTKFLPPSSDDEISEESIQSPRVQEMKDEEIQDSPRSCVIPPPCKPPRSWDLIQSGVIDDPKVLEPRRRSLLPLGSLRSRRESFNESPSGAESSSFHDDSPHRGQGDADQWLGNQNFRKSDDKRDSLTRRHLNMSENEGSKESPSTKYEEIQVKSIHEQEDNSKHCKENKNGSTSMGPGGDADVKNGKESLKGSSSGSDWDSDDSLPLDNYPPVANVTISPAEDTNSPLKVFRVIKSSDLKVPDNDDDFKDGSPYSLNSEKRGRFLMRAPSIDLTDDDTETGRKHSHSSASSDQGKPKSDNKEESDGDKNHSATGTLGRDGTLRGYEEVWESNAHLPPTNIVLSTVPSGIPDTHITIKEELEESLVWSSPQYDGNRIPPRLHCPKESSEKWNNNEDNLLYPSPRFDQKSKSEDLPESSYSTEDPKRQASLDDYNRKNNGLKMESRSLDDLDPQIHIADPKVPRTRKHSRQHSISMQSWSKSEELQEKPTSSAHIERMIEENKRINAQLRCYDEALRDLAHVSVVRKQTSLSLPRAKEVSGLARSQSAGARNEGYFSLPSASNFAPREMAQSAIVKKQGSLSLPRTSEIPDFAMMQSLGPKKQGHSSLPSTNEFGMRELAQTAIVKRQGSLSLPRTCEIPDLAAAANEEYLSLPRSNELIDEAFKEIGQSTATMKRGSRSLPRSIDPKSISLGADPIPPPRHKKSRSRRRAESEGETSSTSLKDSIRSHSLDVKRHTPKGSESSTPNTKSPEKPKSETAIDKVETPSVDSASSSGSVKETSAAEKPLRKKRKMLLAMRGFLGTNRKNINDNTVNEASLEESFDEPPFWMSTDKSGLLERQGTVIERPNFSSEKKESMGPSPSKLETVVSEEKEESHQESLVKEQSELVDDTLPSNSIHEEILPQEEVARSEGKDTIDSILPEPIHKDSSDIQRDSQSDDAESGLSHSDNTPQHVYLLKGHHNLLKEHLQLATAEKGRLEETAAELGERAEKLKYELAEARAAMRNRDEVIALLEGQLSRLEEKYTRSMEESQKYKLRLGNLEQELKHLKEVCNKYEDEKIQLTEIIRLKEMEKINLDRTISAKDEEQKLQSLIGEKEAEQKQHELEIHMNYLQIEKDKLSDEVIKLERKNEDLRLKLDAVVARNQLLNEEKAAFCAKNSLSIKTLQEHSERWKLLYETCMDKLKLLTSNRKSVDQDTQISNESEVDKLNFKFEVQEIIHRIEETKEKDYAIWQNKIQEDLVNAVQLLNAEYSRIETSLLTQNEKLEIVIEKLIENLGISPTKHLGDKSLGVTGTAAEALKLVEELTQLNVDLKAQYQQLKIQLEHRHEELRKKSEIMKPSTELGSGEASKIEQDLLKENMLLKEQLMQILDHSPEESRELWKQLKVENTKLQEQLNLLVEHIKELEKVGDKETFATPKDTAEHIRSLYKQKESNCKCVHADDTVTSPEKCTKLRNSEEPEEGDDDDGDESPEDILEDLEDIEKQEQSPYYARELFDELKNENMQLQKQLDLLVEQIKEKEDFSDKETITDKDLDAEELYLENVELKNKLAGFEDSVKCKEMQEKQTLTEPLVWEPPEEYNKILNELKSENEKLKVQLQSLEDCVNSKVTMQNTSVMTEDDIWQEGMKYKEENAKLKKHISVLQNKIRQQKLEDMGEGEFDPLFEEEEEEEEEGEYVVDNATALGMSQKVTPSPNKREKSNYKNRLTQFQLEYAQEQLEKMEEQRTAVLHENKMLQERLNEQARIRDREIVDKLASDKEVLEEELNALRNELTELRSNTLSECHNVQTMTDPDMELVHSSMENAALQSQLKQLSKKYETKQGELEKTVLLLRESREASSILLQETKNASVLENSILRKELEDVRQQLRNQEQEMVKTRNDSSRDIQPPKVAELCNLLDHLRKENTELQEQLKKMLSEREEKDEVEIECQAHELNEATSKDCNLGEKSVVNKNIDSIALLLTVGSHMKANENIDMSKNSQNCCPPTIRVQEHCPTVVINDNRREDGIIQQQPYILAECKTQNVLNGKRKEQDFLNVKFSKSQPRKYSAPDLGSKDEEFESMPLRSQTSGAHTSTTSLKNHISQMDSHSSSSELYSDMKLNQRHTLHGLLVDNGNSELGQEPISRLSFRPNRDAATNTTPSAQSLELQRELQLEKERCKKYQQNVKKLKSDVQVLKNKLSENKKPGKTDSNLAMKQNNTNNSSLLPSVQSPSHFDHNMAEFQRQIAELEQKVREENSMRFSLEVQVNKMRYELQEKLQLEKELSLLRNRLEKDFVSRYELEQLRNSYEVALSRAKYEAEMAARDDLNEKLCQINSFIEKQVQEQTRLSQLRNTTEAQMKQDFQETRLKLLSELAKVQASLQAKGEEEKELREKCEKLTRECEKKQEIRRKKLIEKSYNVNLAPSSNLKEKEMNSKGYVLDMRSPLHRPTTVQPIINTMSSSSATTTQVPDPWPSEHPFSHILRRELERSIRKHTRTDSLTDHPSSSGSAQPTASEEHLELLKKKYFLH